MRTTILAIGLLLPCLAMAQSPAGNQSQMPDFPKMFFQQFDKNNDGRVSKQEFLAPTAQQFDAMDNNGDGIVSNAEITAFSKMMVQRMMQMQKQMQQKAGQQGGQQGYR